MKNITKGEFISFLIDTRGYTEEEAKKIINIYGVLEFKHEAMAFYS